ncbi:serine hydrolase [uncultured Ramlibacter sp.]|uniref:serine hydrolase n=1 Tax=uncultured Ramlibacter sp. TaxID=260755 RepID=UPI00261AFBC6|nr:serine hydrolase [uncultured Ramlibacter sp.]
MPSPSSALEEVETGDTEPVQDKVLPRRSAGHAAGLHKTVDPLRLASSAAMVIDARTRQVLFAKNQEAVLPMASITKLMTGLVIAESGLPLDATLAITEDDVDNELHSRSRLRVGTVLTRGQALQLALMSSENRAAHALGRTWPQGMVAFVAAMNAKATQLGMTNTSYVDPTGLSRGNRSSARDLSVLAVAASRHELLREYSTSAQHRLQAEPRDLLYNNSNRLVRNGGWDISLQKTGYIIEAGHCMVLRTRIAGRDLALVLLDAGDAGARSADAERIRRWIEPGWEPPKPQARSKAKAKAKAARGAGRAAGERQRVRKTFN